MLILGIETSCDETSMSIVRDGREVIKTITYSQIETHEKYGGVVPEVASRKHLEVMTVVLEKLLEESNIKLDEIDAFAVTYGPGLVGSLLIGIQIAKTLSFLYNKPLIPVHHIKAHIYASFLDKEISFPVLALVVSGGHTELIYMKKHNEFEVLGRTFDDAVGEAYDKVARIMSLPYPGGPIIDKMAKVGEDTYDLPFPMNDDSLNFSFSGLKSATLNLINNEKQRGNEIRVEDLCTSFQNRVVNTLISKTKKALMKKDVKTFVLAGGVAANSLLRERVKKLDVENIVVPNFEFCTDNAAMVASYAYYAYNDGIVSNLKLDVKPGDKI